MAPICDECAWEADRGKPTPDDFLTQALQKWHNAGSYAPMGHSGCKGGTHCYCQHKHHGAWKGVEADDGD